jgi:DNA polymerase III subunit delta'
MKPMPKSPPIDLNPPERLDAPAKLIGHGRIVDYFRNVGPEGLAHAYLFHGPDGVGKTTFARTLALTLHCERPTSFPLGYCGSCGACIRGMAGSSGDTILVDERFISALDPKSERKVAGVNVDVAHEIIRLMQMRSYEGGRLVCIVPDFDLITYDYVYNLFLKELEELDPGKLFLLTTQRPERILPTIRSRSVMMRFGPLTDDEVARGLAVAGESKTSAAAIARRSQGSLGDAFEQRDEDTSAFREAARAWALACVGRPGSLPPMPVMEKESARSALDAILRHSRLALRDLLAYVTVGEAAVLDVDAVTQYEKVAGALGTRAAQRASAGLAALAEAERLAATNASPGVVFGWLQVQLRSLDSR